MSSYFFFFQLSPFLQQCDSTLTVRRREILVQVMVYAGMPTGLEAFRTADAAIQAWKAEHQS